MDDGEALRRERDLLERLLDLSGVDDPAAFLREALAVAVGRARALRGYIALIGEGDAPRWWAADGWSDAEVADIQARVSAGIIGAAIASGRSLRIANAMLDPAWSERASVARNHVEGVLCAPIGADPPRGVIYLQGQPGGDRFTAEDEAALVRMAGWLAPLAARLLAGHDRTADLRSRLDVADLRGASAPMHALLREIELAARFDADVLLTGPTGSGKTAVARAIARNSGRRDGPFVEVGCGSLFADRFDGEFFGALPGSFTGAPREGLTGFVPAARGGTLFLDEVGELPLPAQAALLKFLDDDKRYRRLGEAASHPADVRVIAATHRDLEADVREGRFRQDLWHRLSTLVIRVPGLDERRSDIPALAAWLAAERARRHRVATPRLTPAAVSALEHAPWPGNVRQLGKVIEVGLMRADLRGDGVITAADLFGEGAPGAAQETWQQATWRYQGSLLADRLEEHDWNVAQAAASLDMAVSHLYALIKAHGLKRRR